MGNEAINTVWGTTVEVLKVTSRKVTLRNPVSKNVWTVARSYFKLVYVHPLWA